MLILKRFDDYCFKDELKWKPDENGYMYIRFSKDTCRIDGLEYGTTYRLDKEKYDEFHNAESKLYCYLTDKKEEDEEEVDLSFLTRQ